MAAALRRLGFEVTTELDTDFAGLNGALRAFSRRSSGADVSLVFYAGHGMELDGVNHLLPVDARLEHDTDVRYETATLDDVLAATTGASLQVVILDACRDKSARAFDRTDGTLRPPTGHHHCVRTEEPARPSAANPRRRPVDELTSRARPHSVSPPPSGSSSELASSVSPSSTALVGSSGRFRLAAKALAPASVGVVHTIALVKAAAVYEGISMIATRAHARLSTAKGRRMGESPRVCGRSRDRGLGRRTR